MLIMFKYVNLFLVNVSFLYPLKTSENLSFSNFFMGYRKNTLAETGLLMTVPGI